MGDLNRDLSRCISQSDGDSNFSQTYQLLFYKKTARFSNLQHHLSSLSILPSSRLFPYLAIVFFKFVSAGILRFCIAPLLAVRTFGSTSFLEIKWNGQVRVLAEVKSSDVGHHQVVDLKPSGNPFETLFVNNNGAVFSIRIAETLNAQYVFS